ncbi:zinc finger protein 250-like, partial [Hyperolius riggenbachi]|uniref:zinc finger protein 250-like n=1 Tax=Hyperolius riggenbachi TaxID=752182 RepID=UPI0035A2628A
MTTSLTMEEDQSHVTGKIFNLTLEVISLLTGESFPPVKSGNHVTITVPSSHSLISERHKQKILKVTRKMMELLTGEVAMRCEDVAVYFSMEEWQYIEGHQDLYKDAMMEKHPPLTSPDVSSNRNPPERCTGPLYSQDCTQEDLSIPHHDQGGEDVTAVVPEEEQETSVRSDQQPMEEGEIITGMSIARSPGIRNLSETRLSVSTDCTTDHDVTGQESPADILVIPNIPPDSTHLSNPEEPHTQHSSPPAGGSYSCSTYLTLRSHTTGNTYSCAECGKCLKFKTLLVRLERCHTDEKPYSCAECGKCFTHKSHLVRHKRSHSGEKAYACAECGKCFSQKRSLVVHGIIHTGEKPYSCAECGKCFNQKLNLVIHERSHTGEKPYPCAECGKCFSQKRILVSHERSHTGEKPYSCAECGKCFSQKRILVRHERSHTGVKPYSCAECGKCFSQKRNLVTHERSHTVHIVVHERSHTGENPYSCAECGKCFAHKVHLVVHERSHTGEKPYSCADHERSHTGEKPYSCAECGKCFSQKRSLVRHERSHTEPETPAPNIDQRFLGLGVTPREKIKRKALEEEDVEKEEESSDGGLSPWVYNTFGLTTRALKERTYEHVKNIRKRYMDHSVSAHFQEKHNCNPKGLTFAAIAQ